MTHHGAPTHHPAVKDEQLSPFKATGLQNVLRFVFDFVFEQFTATDDQCARACVAGPLGVTFAQRLKIIVTCAQPPSQRVTLPHTQAFGVWIKM